ncbi:hypothetical protein KR767_04090 [Luteibacter anthropi]|uniref:hypothetical protein n=1 Tax=Luteibacter anthropi TaxID=564369 RepID=UPI0020322B5E|nr:hypothetical protein [Luteibacter anthropi]URX63257.1 hypothetical protein KR767_04090 [Luteibacter anthropi]
MTAIRSAIVAKIQSIPDVGVVHAYERYATAMDKLKSLYVAPGGDRLLGWFVRRQAIAESSANGRARIVDTTWRVQGVMALNDSDRSELLFDDLIEALRDAFRIDTTLGGLCKAPIPAGEPAGLQLIDAGTVMFAGVLCHGARLALRTHHLVTA